MAVNLYVHLTWTTERRRPLVDRAVVEILGGLFRTIAARHHTGVLEVAFLTDHVHVLVALPATLDLPRLVQGFKGAGSRVVNRDLNRTGSDKLQWEAGYDARSVSPRALDAARRYLRGQDEHHPLDQIGD